MLPSEDDGGDIAVDHEHLMHLPVEVGIALLQVVADLVRFNSMFKTPDHLMLKR